LLGAEGFVDLADGGFFYGEGLGEEKQQREHGSILGVDRNFARKVAFRISELVMEVLFWRRRAFSLVADGTCICPRLQRPEYCYVWGFAEPIGNRNGPPWP
jgi:hypothetical protein